MGNSRLLTNHRIMEIVRQKFPEFPEENIIWSFVEQLRVEQDAKTASIIQTEATKYYAEKMAEAIERLRIKKDAEHQQKIAEIFEEIERLSHPMNTNMTGISISKVEWQGFKSRILNKEKG